MRSLDAPPQPTPPPRRARGRGRLRLRWAGLSGSVSASEGQAGWWGFNPWTKSGFGRLVSMREEKEGLRRIAKASGTIAKIRRMVTASGHVYLRKGARGGVWYAKFRLPDGSQINERLGKEWTERGRPQAGYLTRRMAEARLRELLADAQRGTLAAQHKTGATFGDACAEWLRYTEHDRGRAPSTVSDYRSAVSHSLLPAFGSERPLEEMTAARIDAYRAQMVGEGKLSNRTINKQLVMLNGIFRRAQRVWGPPTNPAAMVERQPVHRTGDFNVLTPGEVEALARAAASEQDAALFVTAAFSGLRMGELRGLCWGDVDFAKRLIHVPRGFTRSTARPYEVAQGPQRSDDRPGDAGSRRAFPARVLHRRRRLGVRRRGRPATSTMAGCAGASRRPSSRPG